MMTKEECIKRLKEAKYTIQPFCYINEAIDYAIKELQNPPLKYEESCIPCSERLPEKDGIHFVHY